MKAQGLLFTVGLLAMGLSSATAQSLDDGYDYICDSAAENLCIGIPPDVVDVPASVILPRSAHVEKERIPTRLPEKRSTAQQAGHAAGTAALTVSPAELAAAGMAAEPQLENDFRADALLRQTPELDPAMAEALNLQKQIRDLEVFLTSSGSSRQLLDAQAAQRAERVMGKK